MTGVSFDDLIEDEEITAYEEPERFLVDYHGNQIAQGAGMDVDEAFEEAYDKLPSDVTQLGALAYEDNESCYVAIGYEEELVGLQGEALRQLPSVAIPGSSVITRSGKSIDVFDEEDSS